MIPKLYQKDGTTLIGALTNCIECLVEEERNGIFEVTFQYPNTESISSSLVYDNIVICDANDTLKNQKFRIYDTRRMMNNTIEVYARHISFDLAYDYINSIDITNQSCEYALNTIFRSSQFCTGYVGHSDIVNAQNYKISNCNALEAIAGKQGSIIDTYGTGAEILRDNTDIYVLNKRGNDNEVSIEYAKNLTGFELQENTDDLITRIIPFATYTPEGGEQTRVQGSTVDSSYINNYSHPFIAEIDFSDKFEDNETPTPSKLTTMAQLYFEENKCDLPKQNWKIEFIPLSKCVGYGSIEDAISLCDTVTIKDTRYNIDTKAKVIKTVYDVLRERYDSMELGEPRTTLGDIVNTGSEKGEQGPPGPPGPKGEDGNIGDFPDSVPSTPVLTTTLLGFASIQLDWTYDNKPYYWYEVYASKTKDFTPNLFDIVHKGQTSSFLFQAKPGETWYFRVCGVNSYDHRSGFSDQKEVITTKVDDLTNYFTTAAIGQAVVGSLTADYMEAGIIKGNWIDAKNLSVTDGNGKRTLDIDSFGNVNLDVTSLRIASEDVSGKFTKLEQKSDAIEVKLGHNGYDNIILNSTFKNNANKWALKDFNNIAYNKYKTETVYNNEFAGRSGVHLWGESSNGDYDSSFCLYQDIEGTYPIGDHTIACKGLIYQGGFKLIASIYNVSGSTWTTLDQVEIGGNHNKDTFAHLTTYSVGNVLRVEIVPTGRGTTGNTAFSLDVGDVRYYQGTAEVSWQPNSNETFGGTIRLDPEDGIVVKHENGHKTQMTSSEVAFIDDNNAKHMSIQKSSIKFYDYELARYLGELTPYKLNLNQGEFGTTYLGSQYAKFFNFGYDANVANDTDTPQEQNITSFLRVVFQELGGDTVNRPGTHVLNAPLFIHDNIDFGHNGIILSQTEDGLHIGGNTLTQIGTRDSNGYVVGMITCNGENGSITMSPSGGTYVKSKLSISGSYNNDDYGIELGKQDVWIQSWNTSINMHGVKINGHSICSYDSDTINFIKPDGDWSFLRGNYIGVTSTSDASATSLMSEDYVTDNGDGTADINLSEAVVSLYNENTELTAENKELKQQQVEQDELIVENAYELANIQLGGI